MSPSLLTNNQMDSSPASLRIFRALGKLAACIAGLSLALPTPAFADLLDQRSELINKFVNEMHADPLAATKRLAEPLRSTLDHLASTSSDTRVARRHAKIRRLGLAGIDGV